MTNKVAYNLYVYPGELRAYDQAADRLGLSRSSWVTMILACPSAPPVNGSLHRRYGAKRIGLHLSTSPPNADYVRARLRAAAHYAPPQ